MDTTPPSNPAQPSIPTQGAYAATPSTTYTWRNVTTGGHTFAVELVNNDNTPLNPMVYDTGTILVP
jgi:hypothetical protein